MQGATFIAPFARHCNSSLATALTWRSVAARVRGHPAAIPWTVKDFDRFAVVGFGVHFGTREQAEDRINAKYCDLNTPRMIAADVELRRPLRLRDACRWQTARFVVPVVRENGAIPDVELADSGGASDVRCGKRGRAGAPARHHRRPRVRWDRLLERWGRQEAEGFLIAFDSSQIRIINRNCYKDSRHRRRPCLCHRPFPTRRKALNPRQRSCANPDPPTPACRPPPAIRFFLLELSLKVGGLFGGNLNPVERQQTPGGPA